MENYKITKEQILETIRTGTDVTKRYFKEIIPEAFKTELEVGKWYKMKGVIHFLCNFNGNIGNNGNSYGFNLNGEWMDNSMCFHNSDTYVEATPEEVESALINEAKKRGYKEGVRIKGLESGYSRIIPDGKFEFLSHNLLRFGSINEGYDIFKYGKWAEILPQEKTVVPMAKALEIIAKKLKVSPENIEIQY